MAHSLPRLGIGCLVVTFSARAAAAPEPAAPEPAAPATPLLRAPGTFELRIQTATNVAASGGLAVASAPGFAYDTDTHDYMVNLVAGAGYFLNPSFALGLDASYTRVGGTYPGTLVAVAPFGKFVTGQSPKLPGFFTELSPALVFVDDAGGLGDYLQLGTWLGVHVPLGTSLGLLVGPSAAFVERLDEREDVEFLIGFRIGVSVYLK